MGIQSQPRAGMAQPVLAAQATEAALQQWRNLLGEQNVKASAEVLTRTQTATFATAQRVPAVILPGNTAEVQQALRVANQFKVAVYPLSSGKNWGYGSMVPPADACVVMSLTRMNRILDFSEELGHVTLEPGVTQRQLFEFLQQKKSKLWMDATGTCLDSSLIGNTLERGFGHTPYGDHVANICGLEVVLPDGECLHTGLGRFGNAQAEKVYRWGIGPHLDGLFAQSSFGVVTRLTLWLMPAPEYFESFAFRVDRDEQLEPLIDALAPLRLDGTLRSALHIGNDYKVLSAIQQYPWKEMNGGVPLSRAVMDHFKKAWDFGAWNGSGALYGSRAQVAASRTKVKAALKGKVKRLNFLHDRKLEFARRIQRPYQWCTGTNLAELLKILRPVYGLMKGIPTNEMIPSTYWRKKTPGSCEGDPNRDRCGLLWLAPICPTRGSCARQMLQTIEATFGKYPFEPIMAFTLLTERTLDNVICIMYDRDVPGEDQRAMQCHDELLQRLSAEGFYPYRLGIQSMGKLPPGEPTYAQFMRRLKDMLDPNHILAPGRYE